MIMVKRIDWHCEKVRETTFDIKMRRKDKITIIDWFYHRQERRVLERSP